MALDTRLRFTKMQVDLREAAAIIISLLSLLCAGAAAYYNNDKQIEHRLSVVETKTDSDQHQLDHIQVQVDKLVEWALGKQ
jgi:hypothetical protein